VWKPYKRSHPKENNNKEIRNPEREVGPARKSQSKLYFSEKTGQPPGKRSLAE
jgi:hypothetical protein